MKKEQNLHVYWYTGECSLHLGFKEPKLTSCSFSGKDQMKPLNAVHKSRNCHVKFMSVDGKCAILGNGNLFVLFDRPPSPLLG